jgi:hypothetical protein
MKDELIAIGMMILATIVLIILSIVYFIIVLFVVNVAADIVFSDSLSADWGVLAAAIVTLGSMLGGTMGRGKTVFMKGD